MPEKRLTSPSHIRNWLKIVAMHCAGNTLAADLKGPIEMYAVELSVLYPQACFTTASAAEIAMAFQFGFPTMVQIRKQLDLFMKTLPSSTKQQGEGGTAGKINLSEARLSDGRISVMDFADRVLIAQYDKRIREITEEGDPFWDSEDPDLKIAAKRVNLASMYRQYIPNVWTILTNPPHGQAIAPEVEFLLRRTAMMKAQQEERARSHGERKDAANRPPPESYDDEVNF